MFPSVLKYSLLAATAFISLSCDKPHLKEEVKRFEEVVWSDVPGWAEDDLVHVSDNLEITCKKWQKRPSDWLVSEKYPEVFGTYGSWKELCSQLKNTPHLKTFIQNNLQPYRVNSEEGSLFTGYYAPYLEGSVQPKTGYNTPLYARPNNLYTARLGDFKDELQGQTIVGRVVGNRFVPYATREEFTKKQNKDAEVLLWLKNPVDAFFLHIQGSGWVKTPKGDVHHVSYAGNNGHDYVAIGRTLINKGFMKKEDVSLDSLRSWLEDNPEKREEVFNSNPRYIFFGLDQNYTKGSFGVPLIAERSLAVDPKFIPLGTPLFVSTSNTADQTSFKKMMFAHDTGAAINGAVRGDIFFGDGEKAGEKAGYQNSAGELYVFGLKPKV